MDKNILKSKCNECNQETKHDIKASYIKKGSDVVQAHYEMHIEWSETWETLECRGCENVHVRRSDWFSEGEGVGLIYYPATTSKRKPRWITDIKDDVLSNLLHELYVAHEADIRFSTITACRTIIERVMTLKVGDGAFKQRLNKLADQGFIAKSDIQLIDVALEAGHASSHRGWSPQESSMVDTVIGIVENLVEKLFVLQSLSEELEKKIPKRE